MGGAEAMAPRVESKGTEERRVVLVQGAERVASKVVRPVEALMAACSVTNRRHILFRR